MSFPNSTIFDSVPVPVPPAAVRDLSSKTKEFAFCLSPGVFDVSLLCWATKYVPGEKQRTFWQAPCKGMCHPLLLQLRAEHLLLRDRGQLYICSCRHRDSFYSRGVHKLQALGGDQQFILYKTDTRAEQLHFSPQQFRECRPRDWSSPWRTMNCLPVASYQ